jgi:ketosteroid isomerase-like protein
MRCAVALIALFAVAACSGPRPPAEPSVAREALMAADRAFAAETARRGLEGWMGAYTGDAVRLYMGGTAVQGLEAIRAFDAEIFADPGLRLLWEPADAGVFADGRHGFTTGRSAFVRLEGERQDTLQTGRYVTIWRLGADGRWRVILDTGAVDPPR